MKHTVGVVGLGIMGGAYARNLLSKGFEVVGYDVDADRCKALEALGLKVAASPSDVARQCDGVVTSLPSPAAFHAVMTGPKGLVEAGRDVVVADTSTLALSDKEQAHQALAAADVTLLDCPVSGTGTQAAKGDLVFFASGECCPFPNHNCCLWHDQMCDILDLLEPSNCLGPPQSQMVVRV